ncbi:hypothetical protein PFICI_05071 [Pestalotiopsis fici W106-1]|uniref:Uncharacterized protein n=1 Tax=Pestalotiopsis fici (strain W106-1 / CGMCC3.15140) TaxID=1229662 RepID=W3XAW9_PESFW|nr:uncharacterized protein PFICI_05071 [Pestalotiopsis fici W106-1]ETS83195.1 hypothetical protein PFICI_05071 [Pestalotiopsis fici W106-1]
MLFFAWLMRNLGISAFFCCNAIAFGLEDDACQKGFFLSLAPLAVDPWVKQFCSDIKTETSVATTIITETSVSNAIVTTASSTSTTTTATIASISTSTTIATSTITSTIVTTSTSTSTSTETTTTTISVIGVKKRSIGCHKEKTTPSVKWPSHVSHGRPGLYQSHSQSAPTLASNSGLDDILPSDSQNPEAAAYDGLVKPIPDIPAKHYSGGWAQIDDFPDIATAPFSYYSPTQHTPTIPTGGSYSPGSRADFCDDDGDVNYIYVCSNSY